VEKCPGSGCSEDKKPEHAELQSEQPAVSIEDVRAVLAEKSQEGMVDQIRELLKSFGAGRLSDVDPSKLPDLLEAAKALKGGDVNATEES